MTISIDELRDLTTNAIKKYGYNDAEVKVISEVLLYAQLRGNNQGVVKLIGNGIPKRDGIIDIKAEKESPVSALVNGGRNHSMLAMSFITDLAIKKAKKSGIAIVGSYNTDESTGALGYYANKIAEEGLIGHVMSSAPFETTAPYGSSEAKFCTNPMAYGIPTENDPIILDFTTSAIAYYGLIEAKTAGKDVDQGLGYDSEGKDTTNPAEIMSGAIKAFGGHKGSGLALMVQILAGALVKGDSFNSDSDNAGNLVMAINPEILSGSADFKTETSRIISELKSAKKLAGFDEILIPGERGNKMYKKVIEAGEIEIEENLYNELKKVAK